MKKITLITILVFILISCDIKNEKHKPLHADKEGAPFSKNGCLESFETINGDTINKTVDGDIKNGHWIHYEFVMPTNKKNKDAKVVRAKMEEGYYKENKKVGFWKFYYKDGTLKDSVEYKNDRPVLNY